MKFPLSKTSRFVLSRLAWSLTTTGAALLTWTAWTIREAATHGTPFAAKSTFEIVVHNPAKGEEDVNPAPQDPALYRAVETEVVASHETLGNVVERLKLVSRWGLSSRAKASEKLATMTSVHTHPVTSLVDVVVTASNANEAAELANEIAAASASRRNELLQEVVSKQIAAIDGTVRKQREMTESRRQEMQRLMEKSGIRDPKAMTPGEAQPKFVAGKDQRVPDSPEDFEKLKGYLEARTSFLLQQELLDDLMARGERLKLSTVYPRNSAVFHQFATPDLAVPVAPTSWLSSPGSGGLGGGAALVLIGGFCLYVVHYRRPVRYETALPAAATAVS